MSRVRLVFLGLLAVLAVSAVASASASASGPYVYAKGGSFPLMGALELSITQNGAATLEGTLAGIKTKISCEKADASGSLENVLTPGIEHALGSTVIDYLACTVVKPAGHGCLVHNNLILVSSHALAISGPLVKFGPASGSTKFTEIILDGCNSEAEINGTYPVTGVASAIPNNTNSTLEFTTSSGGALEFAGLPATFVANYKVEMKGGGELEIK